MPTEFDRSDAQHSVEVSDRPAHTGQGGLEAAPTGIQANAPVDEIGPTVPVHVAGEDHRDAVVANSFIATEIGRG